MKTETNTYKVEVNTRGAYLSAANNYDIFYKAINEFIDNSISAKASEINIHLDLNKLSRFYILDNGVGVPATEAGVRKLNVLFDIKKSEDKDGPLNEHGTGLKGAGFAIGQIFKIVSKVRGSKNALLISNYDFQGKDVSLKWSILDKSKMFDDMGHDSGTLIELSSKRIDGKEGLSLFKSNLIDQKKVLKAFYNDIQKIYRLALNDGLVITITSSYKGSSLETRILKGFELPGKEFLSKIVKAGNSQVRLTLQEGCSRYELKDTPFELDDSKEEQKYFIMHKKVLFMPDNSDCRYGLSMKDASMSQLKLFIEVLKSDINIRTTTTKSGLIDNESFQEISKAVKTFWSHHVTNEIKRRGGNLSPTDYFKAVKAGTPIFVEKNQHDRLKLEKFEKFNAEAKLINDHIGKKSIEVFNEFSVNLKTDSGSKTHKLDFVKINHDKRLFTLGEVKVKDFSASNAVQVAMYAKSIKEQEHFKDYEIELLIVAPSIDQDVKTLLEMIPCFSSGVKLDNSDF